MNNNGYGPFGQPIWKEEDYLQAEMERLRFQTEHPEEYKKQLEKRKKASEEARKRIEAAKKLPQDYFDGWEVHEVKRGESGWSIAKTFLGSGARCSELKKNNEQQMPFGWNSLKAGMKLRIREIKPTTMEEQKQAIKEAALAAGIKVEEKGTH